MNSLHRLSDAELLTQLKAMARQERAATARVIAHLAVVDARRLYLPEGCSSMFTYCTRVLHFSERAAYARIEVARAARRFPLLLARLAEGALNLTTVRLLSPHLTAANHRDVLDEAAHGSRRQVEELVARLRPLPPVPASIRKLPAPARAAAATAPRDDLPLELTPPADNEIPGVAPMTEGAAASAESPAAAGVGITAAAGADAPADNTAAAGTAAAAGNAAAGNAAAGNAAAGNAAAGNAAAGNAAAAIPRPSHRAVILPLAPHYYRLQVTLRADTHARLRQAQELMRHQVPDGDPAAILDRALRDLVEKLSRRKFAALTRARAGGR